MGLNPAEPLEKWEGGEAEEGQEQDSVPWEGGGRQMVSRCLVEVPVGLQGTEDLEKPLLS